MELQCRHRCWRKCQQSEPGLGFLPDQSLATAAIRDPGRGLAQSAARTESREGAEFTYAHPLFDGPAIAAQARLHEIQGVDRLWFCGAWGGYGFHEDGLRSGMQVAAALGCQAPWQKPVMPLDAALAPAVVAMQ